MNRLQAGFAEIDYTPELGLPLRGQLYRRLAERVRDPLMVSAMALRSGDETVVIASVDICFVTTEFVTETQELFRDRTSLPASRLLVHTTHSHVAPVAAGYHWGQPDPDFLEHLKQCIARAAEEALRAIEPVTLFSGAGELPNLGWNRRAMFSDGTTAMHGDVTRPDYIGREGPVDPTLSVFFARGEDGGIRGVTLNFGIHPNCVEHGCYYSADLPGEVRRLLKLLLGQDVRIVYLTGPAGNVTPVIPQPRGSDQPWMGEEGLLRSGLYMAGEAAKVIASATEPIAEPVLRVAQTAVPIPLRPFPEPGETCYPSFWSDEAKDYYMETKADWPRRMREENPVEVRLSAIRIGDTAICTNPAELFCEFGLKMREASPARVTLLSQLTDGYVGYIPTPLSFSRGGYETWPAQSSKLIPEAGDQMVEATRGLLEKVFGRGK